MDKKVLLNKVWNGEVNCDRCRIKELVLFAHLTPEDFNHIHTPIMDVEFSPSEKLYSEGKPGKHIYTIRSGLVKLETKQPDGNHRVVRLLTQGDVTGLEAIIEEPYHHTATALKNAEVCKIPVDVIHNLQTHSQILCSDIMDRWSKSVRQADEWLAKLNTGPARQRVDELINYLIENSETAPEFFLPSRDDIASILGLTRETVSRAIADMKRDGRISSYGHGIYERNIVDI